MKSRSFLVALLFSSSALAYEVETHGAITDNAFEYSILGTRNPNQADVYSRLGFDRVDVRQPFFQTIGSSCSASSSTPQVNAYTDPDPAWLTQNNPDTGNLRVRCPQEYERNSMSPAFRGLVPSTLGPTPHLRFEDWLMRGVIREDDLKCVQRRRTRIF